MSLTAAEQFLLELTNRARLDPSGEARRLGIDLNQGLAAGTISAAAKQVLAPNALLESAATSHSLWMITNNTVSHTGAGGSSPAGRVTAAGYSWTRVGENIAWWGTTGKVDMNAAITTHYTGLFNSAGHRQNILNADYREMGIGHEGGSMLMNGTRWNSSVLTEVFATPASGARFITGVAFNDRNADGFYGIGEGVGGITLSAAGQTATTATAGGYAVTINPASFALGLLVSGTALGTAFQVKLDLTQGNAKLDVVNGTQLLSSVTAELVGGINNLRLLGVASISGTGNANANLITGNAGANGMWGAAGNDTIDGLDGNDRLYGGAGADVIRGGNGNDTIYAGTGSDEAFGGAGADRFVFYNGNGLDVARDFQGGTDRLSIDDAAWTGVRTAAQVVTDFAKVTTSGVLFDFRDGDQILLSGLTTTRGLADWIDII